MTYGEIKDRISELPNYHLRFSKLKRLRIWYMWLVPWVTFGISIKVAGLYGVSLFVAMDWWMYVIGVLVTIFSIGLTIKKCKDYFFLKNCIEEEIYFQ